MTFLLCAAAAFLVPAKYTAKESILLIPPRTGTTGSNPYLSLDTLDGLNSVLVQGLSSTSTADQLKSQGVTGTYTIANDPNSSGPVLIITGTAKTSPAAVSMVQHIAALVPQTLQRLQAQLAVPEKSIVTTTVLSPADKASKVRKSQIRAVIVGAAVGVFGTLLVVAGLDRYLIRRSARRPRVPKAMSEARDDDPLYEDAVTVLVPTRGSEP